MNEECFTDRVIVIIGRVLMIEVPIGGNRSKQTQTLMFFFFFILVAVYSNLNIMYNYKYAHIRNIVRKT